MPAKKIKQKGYAVVLTLVLFAALGLSVLAMFNSGQVTTHKAKLQNAVDAAAYSTATIVSRELNYMAYTNRAMVANQVAIGQMVGMASWIRMMDQASVNLSNVADAFSWVPYVGQVLAYYFGALEYYTDKIAEPAISLATESLIILENATISALANSQELVHLSTQGLVFITFPNVLKDNDPDAVMGAIGAAHLLNYQSEINTFTKRTTAAESGSKDLGKYDQFAELVFSKKTGQGSQDDFMKERSYKWLPTFMLFPRKVWIDKKGGNEFDKKIENGKYVWEWSAMDTVSLWTSRWTPKKGWQDKETIPIGGGAAHTTNESGSYDYSSSDTSKWGGAKRNAIAAQMAISEYGDDDVGTTSALQKFFYIDSTNKNPVPPALIAVASKKSGAVRTWEETIKANGGVVGESFSIEKDGNLVSDQMYTMSKAEPYYSRSHDLTDFVREDNNDEYGNLFNPYWQPRLSDLTTTQKTAVLGLLP